MSIILDHIFNPSRYFITLPKRKIGNLIIYPTDKRVNVPCFRRGTRQICVVWCDGSSWTIVEKGYGKILFNSGVTEGQR